MEQLIERLIEIGYPPNKAEELFEFYNRAGDLDGLESYVIVRESLAECL